MKNNTPNETNNTIVARPDIYDDTSVVSSSQSETGLSVVERDYGPGRRPKKKKSRLKRFFLKFLAVIVAIFLLVILIGWIISLTLPAKTTFLLMATDQDGTRTDTIMYGVFDKSSKQVSLVSIPRDTFITVDDEVYQQMRQSFPQPGSKSMKINTVHHYGGEEYGVDMLIDEIEKLTQTEIDFYAKVNFESFRYIVDAVGGIDFYVPRNMEYHDPLQNLHISLKEGQQRLDGKQAEQLVRYRAGYANADLGRVDVQQQFMKAFISQIFSKGAIASEPLAFVKLVTSDEYVVTNVDFMDVVSYLFVINGLDASLINTYTLDGTPGYAQGQSVYKIDTDKTEEFFAKIYEGEYDE